MPIRPGDPPTVSVIIPTCNRYDVLIENIKNIREQDLPCEIVVCDDTDIKDCGNNTPKVDQIIDLVDSYTYTAVYNYSGEKLYGLGRARNRGIIEATGVFAVFLDDRITPAVPDMLSIFVKKLTKLGKKNWIFGDKGAHKTSFVENCSAVRRKELIISGGFRETINFYGFMTREIYARHKKQGFEFTYVPEALATPLIEKREEEVNERRDKEIIMSKNFLRRMELIK